MTREETIEAIKIMQAWVDGKEVEYYSNRTNSWRICTEPNWNWALEFRIKPAKKLRPWTPDEVPIGAVTRTKSSVNPHNQSRQIIEGENGVVAFLCGSPCSFDYLLETREYSTDYGKTWSACGVEVDCE